jgi:hypothetical protein
LRAIANALGLKSLAQGATSLSDRRIAVDDWWTWMGKAHLTSGAAAPKASTGGSVLPRLTLCAPASVPATPALSSGTTGAPAGGQSAAGGPAQRGVPAGAAPTEVPDEKPQRTDVPGAPKRVKLEWKGDHLRVQAKNLDAVDLKPVQGKIYAWIANLAPSPAKWRDLYALCPDAEVNEQRDEGERRLVSKHISDLKAALPTVLAGEIRSEGAGDSLTYCCSRPRTGFRFKGRNERRGGGGAEYMAK